MINYVILVSDELKEFSTLIHILESHPIPLEDIIVILDEDKYDKSIIDFLISKNIAYYLHSLSGDFSQQRNFAKSKCWHPYILYLDADEIPNYLLLKSLPDVINQNTNIDIIGIPRLNYLENDIDLAVFPSWVSPPEDQLSRIAWPDYQYRLMKNNPNIYWVNPVHEVPVGGLVGQLQPVVQNCIVHIKTVSGQMKRQKFYEQISSSISLSQ